MNAKFGLKSPFNIRIKRNSNIKLDSDRFAYMNELTQASPIRQKINKNELGIILFDLGKSEKFNDKTEVLKILKQLGFVPSINSESLPKVLKFERKNTIEYSSSALSHHLHRKFFTPFTPGVVRIKSQEKFGHLSSSPSKKNFYSRKITPLKPVQSSYNENPIEKIKKKVLNLNTNEYQEIEYNNGDWYKGTIKDNKKEGKGIYFYSLFSLTYAGEYLNDVPNGSGCLKFLSGHKIKGNFINSILQNGFCKITYKDKSKYSGDLKNGMRNGYGSMEYYNRGIYKGN